MAPSELPADSNDGPKLDWAKFPNAGFTVRHWTAPAKPSKKRKRGAAPREPMVQDNEFDAALSGLYTVEPHKWWDDTRRYRKFTIASETFRLGDTVWVKPDPDEEESMPESPLTNWVAKVLEVRAASEQHVFLRVYWMDRPEDLPGGRKPYHGRNEVIASNTMQIIDALTVNGKANVRHWTEDDSAEVLDEEVLFWRQTFDCPDGGPIGTLSKIRHHCIDNAPYNPDTLLVRCDSCQKWLHGECIAQAAIKLAHREHNLPEPELVPASLRPSGAVEAAPNGHTPSQKSSQKKGRRKSSVKEKEQGAPEPAFSAEVISTPGEGKSKIVLKDLREGEGGREFEKPVRCLLCDELIE